MLGQFQVVLLVGAFSVFHELVKFAAFETFLGLLLTLIIVVLLSVLIAVIKVLSLGLELLGVRFNLLDFF